MIAIRSASSPLCGLVGEREDEGEKERRGEERRGEERRGEERRDGKYMHKIGECNDERRALGTREDDGNDYTRKHPPS
jgi:hypothetical protein